MKTCWECLTRAENQGRLLDEGGVTTISRHNAHVLIELHGLPDEVEMYQAQMMPNRGEHLVEARWKNGHRHIFSGFSWGYHGEGPHGLHAFFEMLRFLVPISKRQIAMWPQSGFPALTYVRGEDFGAEVEARAS